MWRLIVLREIPAEGYTILHRASALGRIFLENFAEFFALDISTLITTSKYCQMSWKHHEVSIAFSAKLYSILTKGKSILSCFSLIQ